MCIAYVRSNTSIPHADTHTTHTHNHIHTIHIVHSVHTYTGCVHGWRQWTSSGVPQNVLAPPTPEVNTCDVVGGHPPYVAMGNNIFISSSNEKNWMTFEDKGQHRLSDIIPMAFDYKT